jgi:predicted lipoprotein
MKPKMRIALSIMAVVLIVMLGGCRLYTVVPMIAENKEGIVANQIDSDFDVVSFVNETWSEIENYSASNANNIDEVISLYDTDRDACAEKYISKKVDQANAATFIVSGQVVVLEVNRDSKAGMMSIDVAPFDGVADAYVQVGPVYKANTVRDSMPFLPFENFKNQLTYGELGKEINLYINENVVTKAELDNRIGEQINIVGIFPDGEDIVITPVSIETAQ